MVNKCIKCTWYLNRTGFFSSLFQHTNFAQCVPGAKMQCPEGGWSPALLLVVVGDISCVCSDIQCSVSSRWRGSKTKCDSLVCSFSLPQARLLKSTFLALASLPVREEGNWLPYLGHLPISAAISELSGSFGEMLCMPGNASSGTQSTEVSFAFSRKTS